MSEWPSIKHFRWWFITAGWLRGGCEGHYAVLRLSGSIVHHSQDRLDWQSPFHTLPAPSPFSEPPSDFRSEDPFLDIHSRTKGRPRTAPCRALRDGKRSARWRMQWVSRLLARRRSATTRSTSSLHNIVPHDRRPWRLAVHVCVPDSQRFQQPSMFCNTDA